MGIRSEVGVPRQGLGRCSPLQTWVQQVGLWQAGTRQPLPSATGDVTFLPGAPHLGPRAGRYRLPLQDANHTGAGDKGGASEDRDLPASLASLLPSWRPTPPWPLGSPVVTQPRHHLSELQALPGPEPRPHGVALVLKDP